MKTLFGRVVFPVLSSTAALGQLHKYAVCDAWDHPFRFDGSKPGSNTSSAKVLIHQYPSNDPIEDRCVYKDLTGQKSRWSVLLGVFDGHGGWQVSNFLSTHLLDAVAKTETNTQVKSLFVRVDRNLADAFRPMSDAGFSRVGRVGSCATVVGIDSEWKKITAFNLGDSQAIVIKRSGLVVPLTNVHNANEEAEQVLLRKAHPHEDDVVRCQNSWTEQVPVKRDDKLGGSQTAFETVKKHSGCYVKGRLQPTRSFGDFHLKYPEFNLDMDSKIAGKGYHSDKQTHSSYPYILNEPEVTTHDIREGEDEMLLIGSDGLWDYLSNEKISQVVLAGIKSGSGLGDISKSLVKAVMMKASAATGMTYEQILAIPQGGNRRNIHDDLSIGLVWLDKNKN